MSESKLIYKDWLEDNASVYSGVYLAFDFSNYSQGKVLVKELEVKTIDSNIIAVFSTYFSTDDEKEKKAIELQNVKIETNILNAHNLGDILGHGTNTARFVRQYPPANAKGPVKKGLLVGGEFYVLSKGSQ